MGGQGILLLMKVKFLINMTRLQNNTAACQLLKVIVAGTSNVFQPCHIFIKKFNSINSRKPWSPIFRMFFSMAFLDSWLQLFWCFGWNFISFSFLAKSLLCNNLIWCAN